MNNTAVRVITDGGELVDLTAFTEEADARLSFDAWSSNLEDGEIIQLIEDDRITAEYNPEYHGTAPLDVTEYA